MSVSDIIRSLGSEKMAATVSLVDSAFHVVIHGIELGVREMNDPDASQPNPLEIRYSQEFEIVIHKTVGFKPKTQCTIPEGLWSILVKYNSLKGTDDDLSKNLEKIRDLPAGPQLFLSALFPGGLCTYIQKKEIVQTKGAKDWYHSVEITLLENNSGGV